MNGRTTNGKAPVAVFCAADQMAEVTVAFVEKSYVRLAQPYLMESTLEAQTLSDKRATDTWGIHSLLQERNRNGTPYGTPFGVILRATVENGLKPRKDRVSLADAGNKAFTDAMAKENPKLAGSIQDKYRFALNLSRNWQDDTGENQGLYSQFPFRYALTNYLWWHCIRQDFIVVVSPDPLLALTAVYSKMRVMALTVEDPEYNRMYEGMKSMAYLCHPNQDK